MNENGEDGRWARPWGRGQGAGTPFSGLIRKQLPQRPIWSSLRHPRLEQGWRPLLPPWPPPLLGAENLFRSHRNFPSRETRVSVTANEEKTAGLDLLGGGPEQ